MYEQIRDQYNSWYHAQTGVFRDGKPLPVVERIPTYLPSGSVLDVGGGEGCNALYLADRGLAVTVLDISEVGIAQVEKNAQAAGLSVEVVVADIVQEAVTNTYVCMLLAYVLHHLRTIDAEKVLNDLQTHTVPGGLHVLETFSDAGGLYERNRNKGRFYPSLKTLEQMYAGWEVIERGVKEVASHAKDKSGNRLQNEVVTWVVKKPS